MLITKVELEDIKSHRQSVFEFQRGTTAITGANGAGKTTIIEAIAWALFDFLEYNRDDFVRRGAKKGVVRVTFQSDLDEKFYTVIRETTGKHRVFDEESKTVIHEQNANVMNFIRQHLQVEPGTNLKELYRAAIGVPQGTFTAVFLDNATNRKAVFDRLLKVEEYRESAKKLGETVSLIKDKQSEVKVRLAVAENELKQFDETESQHKQIQAEIAELEKVLADLRSEIEARRRTVEEFEKAKQHLDKTQNRLREARTEQQNAILQQTTIERERDSARQAAERLRELEVDYQTYLTAEIERGKLEKERETRDRLKNEQTRVDKNLINAKAENQSLEKDLRRAIDAGREAQALAPKIVEQEQLENEYKKLLTTRAEARAAKKRVDELEPEIKAKRDEWRNLSEQIKGAEKGANAEQQIAELESKQKQIEDKLCEADKAATTLNLLRPQLRQTENELEKLRENLRKTETEILALEKISGQAARVGELTEIETSLAQKIASLRAAIDLDAKFEREVKNGLCPILTQKCLNLREEETLETYFASKIGKEGETLKNFESQRKQILVDLQTARDAEKKLVKLQTLNEQAANLQKQIAEREANSQKLRDEIAAISDFKPKEGRELRESKTAIKTKLKDLREVAKSYAALAGLRLQIENLRVEGVKLGEEQKKQKEIAQKLGEIETQIAANQNRLRELDNPKARAENARREALRENDLKKNIAEINLRIEELDAEKQKLEIQLSAFAALDEKLATVRATLQRTQSARDEYLRNQTIAGKLPDLENRLEKLTAEVERLKTEVETAQNDFDTATKNYDAEKHAEEKTALDSARTREASANATLSAKIARENQLKETLARLKEVRETMHEDLQEQERLRKVFETTDYIRETLKKAAPHVGEILRYEIAREATNMFREVSGEIGRSLKWTEDYEILLDENGYQRPFANLSGGEQMAAALSIRLALLTQLSDVRVAFFDEPTTNLDRERRERLAQQIGQIRNFNQLFVISHDDTFESNVDHQIYVGGNVSE